MKNTILLACFALVLAGITLLVKAAQETTASQLLHTAVGYEWRGEKDCLKEVMAEVTHYGLVAEQIFTLQTGAEPFKKLQETLLNL